uniref:Uncharacterized protein n=1 Tax=Rhizophora mucronata TaxID=61149 RepID=A0A2P2IHB2_RHIMU
MALLSSLTLTRGALIHLNYGNKILRFTKFVPLIKAQVSPLL